VAALQAGTRYVVNAPSVRRILLRSGLFVIPGSALWALLPVVAHDRLGMGAAGYGGLLGALGVGAVLGALYLARLRARFSTNVLLAASALGFGVATLILGIPLGGAAVPVVSVLMVVGGLAWIVSLSTLNASLQLTLPAWVRARGFGAYLVVFMGGQALGSVAWGGLGSAIGDAGALTAAAILLGLCGLSLKFWPLLKPIAGLGHSTIEQAHWPEPNLVFEPEPTDGPGHGHQALHRGRGRPRGVPGGDGVTSAAPCDVPARRAGPSTATERPRTSTPRSSPSAPGTSTCASTTAA
jgi:MFS family permease